MMCQLLNLPLFARYVQSKQGVSERFWDLLSLLVSVKKFAFRYLGEPSTPTRPNQKYLTLRGDGKSPRLNSPIQ